MKEGPIGPQDAERDFFVMKTSEANKTTSPRFTAAPIVPGRRASTALTTINPVSERSWANVRRENFID